MLALGIVVLGAFVLRDGSTSSIVDVLLYAPFIVVLGVWLWVVGRWALRGGLAQPGALFVLAAMPLILRLGVPATESAQPAAPSSQWFSQLLSASVAIFVGWAAWRGASRTRSTRLAAVLFGATVILLALGEDMDTLLGTVTLCAAVVATGALWIKRLREGNRGESFNREGARSLRQAQYGALAFAFAAIFLVGQALIEWMRDNASPSRAIAQMGFPTHWVVAQALRDEYLWPRTPRASWLNARLPEYLLYAARVDTPDRWSDIGFHGEHEMIDSGTRPRLGIHWVELAGRAFAGYVEPGSQAEVQGVRRGLELVAVRCEDSALEAHRLKDMWKLINKCQSEKIEAVFRDPSAGELPIRWKLTTTPAPDVSHTVLATEGGPVGYLMLRGFHTKDVPMLTQATQSFESAGIKQMVIDLRYNPGGSLRVMTDLADLLVGEQLEGRLFLRTIHGRFDPDRNEDLYFKRHGALKLDSIVFLTGPETCSAAEALIHGLRPHLPVTVIGQRTCGKPVGFRPIETRDAEIFLVSFELLNARSEGRYYQGLRPDCHVVEDLRISLGDPREKLLAAALTLLKTGVCRASVEG